MKEVVSYLTPRSLKNIDKVNYYYILVNIGLSLFSFLRSFVFMRVLDLRELGIISLVQTIFMFIGLLQMGLLNGGYRIISLGKKEEMENTNNTIYSYLAILLPIGIVFCFISSYYHWIKDLTLLLLIISVVFGIFTLLNNWYNNMLIGEQKLREVNIANIISYSVSALMLPLAFWFGFWGGISVIIIQPLLYVCISIIRNRELRPTSFYFDVKYIRYILSFGFIPFLGGIFFMIYLQVERWSIDSVLGVESLGTFYLVFLYVSLFQLVPNSLNSIFFPKGVKSYSEGRHYEFKRIIKYYYLTLVLYGIMIFLVTFFLLEPVVAIVFPNHLPGVPFVYIILPGLILQSLSEPIGLILNSSVILRPILIVSSSNMVLCILAIILMINMNVFSLQNIALIRTGSGCFILFSYVIVYLIIRNKLYRNGDGALSKAM